MRTTLTLDDDLAARLQEIARRQRSSFKEVVNGLLRRGLSAQRQNPGRGPRFRVKTFSSPFRPGVDPLKLNQLLDELEVRERAG